MNRQQIMLDSMQKKELVKINQEFNELENEKLNLMDKLDSILTKPAVHKHQSQLVPNLMTFDPASSKSKYDSDLTQTKSSINLDNSVMNIDGFIHNVIRLFDKRRNTNLMREIFQSWLRVYYETSIKIKSIEIEVKKKHNFSLVRSCFTRWRSSAPTASAMRERASEGNRNLNGTGIVPYVNENRFVKVPEY
jgi:hypothetical protein